MHVHCDAVDIDDVMMRRFLIRGLTVYDWRDYWLMEHGFIAGCALARIQDIEHVSFALFIRCRQRVEHIFRFSTAYDHSLASYYAHDSDAALQPPPHFEVLLSAFSFFSPVLLAPAKPYLIRHDGVVFTNNTNSSAIFISTTRTTAL